MADADGAGAAPSPAQPQDIGDACGRCDGPLGWIDEAWVCSSACTYCPDCKDELGGVCANCSEMLRRRASRTAPIRRISRDLPNPAKQSADPAGPPAQGLK